MLYIDPYHYFMNITSLAEKRIENLPCKPSNPSIEASLAIWQALHRRALSMIIG
jgi:hypothetical protein